MTDKEWRIIRELCIIYLIYALVVLGTKDEYLGLRFRSGSQLS